ncbi:MAG TPA: PUA domain-containing protein [Nitrososphaerales archaeon]|nr:PUA domain-containing protein [Nitrososphaerales archaeon]
MKKWVLSRRDSIDMAERIESSLGVKLGLPRSTQANCEEPEDGTVFLHFAGAVFVQSGDQLFPFLGSKEAISLFPAATVDEGAIKFLLNGADVMRPGVKDYDAWGESGRLVIIKERIKERPIAVGKSTVPSDEMASLTKGVCFKNVHRVGDRFWNLYKTV